MVHHLLQQWRLWNFMRSRVSDSQHSSEIRRWRNPVFCCKIPFAKKKSDTTLPHVEKIIVRICNKYCSSRSELVPTLRSIIVHHLLTQWRIWNFMRSRESDGQHASDRRRWRNPVLLLQDSFCKKQNQIRHYRTQRKSSYGYVISIVPHARRSSQPPLFAGMLSYRCCRTTACFYLLQMRCGDAPRRVVFYGCWFILQDTSLKYQVHAIVIMHSTCEYIVKKITYSCSMIRFSAPRRVWPHKYQQESCSTWGIASKTVVDADHPSS